MRRVKFAILGLIILSLAGGAALLLRHRLTAWSPPESSARLATETRERFSAAPMVEADDRDGLISAFDSAESLDVSHYNDHGEIVADDNAAASVSETERRVLFDTVAEVIELRARADAEAYAEWMRARGYRLKSVQDQLQHPNPKWREQYPRMFAPRFEFKAGREITPTDTPWDLFSLAFEGELVHGRGGTTRPRGIATDPNAIEIWFATLRPEHDPFDIEKPFLPLLFARGSDGESNEDLSQLHWARGQAYMGWAHWAPPVSYREILARDGAVRFARVHCVLQTKGGGVLPTMFILYLDPDTDVWYLPDHPNAMIYSNTYALKLSSVSGPEF